MFKILSLRGRAAHMKFLKTIQCNGVEGVSIDVHIQPNSSKNQVVGLYGDRLKIKIQSPPVDGKANACVIEFLSEIVDLAKSRVGILRGETSREKTVFFEGIDEAQLQKILLDLCPELKS